MKKTLFIFAFVLCAHAAHIAAGEAPPPPEVAGVTLKAETVTLTTELNGRAVAYLVAEVRPQVNGIIKERLFEEGSDVKEGVPLYQIDPAMYEAQLISAQAARAKTEANVEVAAAKKKRYDELVANKAVSQQDYDEVFAAYKQAEADIGVADAEVKIAQINLDYTKVISPISGRIGKSGVTQGALVTANQSSALATIQQLDPIYVDISQSTAGLLDLKRNLDSGTFENTGKGHGAVSLVLENGVEYKHKGEILFSDISVDQSTGSVSVRAKFPNPDWDLMPGMYVKALISFAEKKNAITVPQQALMRGSDGTAIVYVVGEDNSVERRKVVTLNALKDRWLIGSGLKDGERIITEGIQRVRFIPDAPPPKVTFVDVDKEQKSTPAQTSK